MFIPMNHSGLRPLDSIDTRSSPIPLSHILLLPNIMEMLQLQICRNGPFTCLISSQEGYILWYMLLE